MTLKRHNKDADRAKPDSRDSARRNRLGARIAIAVVLAAAILTVISLAWPGGPWYELSQLYPGKASDAARYARGTVEFRSGSNPISTVYRDQVMFRFEEGVLVMEMRPLIAALRPPIAVPAKAVESCRVRGLSDGDGIELWVPKPGIGVGFPRFDQPKVLGWCREHGVGSVDEPRPPQ